MASIGVKLPLTTDSMDGFTMTKTLKDAIKQNFKMLILTNPGERVMDPEFGVGIQQYLFSNYSENIGEQIRERINQQVAIYMPAVSVHSINFYASNPDTNSIAFQIAFSIPDVGISDLLEFTI